MSERPEHTGRLLRDARPWLEHFTERCVLRYRAGSYAEKNAAEIARRVEATLDHASRWFGPPPDAGRCSLYLTDWLEEIVGHGWSKIESGYLSRDEGALWLSFNPEDPAVGLERSLLKLLSPAPAASLSFDAEELLSALALLVKSTEAEVANAEQQVYKSYTRDKLVPHPFDRSPDRNSVASDNTNLSFVLFLSKNYGEGDLSRFIKHTLEHGADAAAKAVFLKPIEVLRNEWLGSLRARWRESAGVIYVIKRLLPLLAPHRGTVVRWFACMLLDLLFTLSIPLSVKYLYDHVISTGSLRTLAWWCAAVFAIYCVGTLAMYQRMVIAGTVGELVLRDLRRTLFSHLQRLPLEFHERAKVGAQASRVISDTASTQSALGQCLPEIIFQAASLVAIVATLLVLDWRLGLVVILVGLPLYTFVHQRNSQQFYRLSRTLQNRVGNATAFVTENLAGQMTVKAFSLESRFTSLFDQQLNRLFRTGSKLSRLNAAISGNNYVLGLGLRLVLMAAGALLVVNNSMTIGDLIAFITLSAQSLIPIWSISNQYQRLQMATGAFDRVQEILEEVPETLQDPRGIELPPLSREIRFEHVTFDYDGGRAELSDVSLVIPAGSSVAVVGPSGSGKSTFLRLLLRLYEPTGGRILFDGQDVRAAKLSSLRAQVGVVLQDTYLFNMSIEENINLGREGAGAGEVVQAAREAAAHEMIESHVAGYKTQVGERGCRLSGGQRQRVAIARAVLRSPRVLIFDEATSALDPTTETAVLNTLNRISRGRTTIIVTHKLSSIVRCDRIFVLNEGRLAEQGTHRELMQARGVYRKLYDEQVGGVAYPAGHAYGAEESLNLREVPVFGELREESLKAVSGLLRAVDYGAGDYIYAQGERAEDLYFIASGEIEIFTRDGSQERRINTLGRGDYFGEVGLFGNELRTVNARATLPSRLYVLSKNDFQGLLEHEPGIRQAVVEIVAKRREEITVAH